MSTVITVTAEDIAGGERNHCSRCPVALAIARALRGAEVWAGPADFFLAFGTGRAFAVNLPPSAQDFIDAFDAGDPVEPFSFTVHIPEVAA